MILYGGVDMFDEEDGFFWGYDNEVVDDNGHPVSALDDDYEYWKHRSEDRYHNPLSDDYIREGYR